MPPVWIQCGTPDPSVAYEVPVADTRRTLFLTAFGSRQRGCHAADAAPMLFTCACVSPSINVYPFLLTMHPYVQASGIHRIVPPSSTAYAVPVALTRNVRCFTAFGSMH